MFHLSWMFYALSIVQGLVTSECSARTITLPYQMHEISQHPTRQKSLSRRVREVSTADVDFAWKPTKTPLFVTAKMKKQNAEPFLIVYPPDISNRSGRSRELLITPGKRVVYYATLPDVPRYSTHPPNDHYTDFIPLSVPEIGFSNQQRSYNPIKVGQDFVTRVSSSIIGVHEGNKDKDVKLSPTFTIIDAPPVHQQYAGPDISMNRIMVYPDYHNKYQFPYSFNDDRITNQRLYPLKLPYTYPYYNDKSQYQHSHQTSPYYGDLEKSQLPHLTPAITNYLSSSPPYPSRHIRFPLEKYPLSSPFSDLRPSKPYTHLPETNHYQNNFNLNIPSSSIGSNFDLNDNLSPSLDNSLDLDYNRFPSSRPFSLRNKFSTNINFDNLANKYLDVHDFHNDYYAYNPQFPQVSDWLANNNKPLDFSSFELDDFNVASAAANTAAIGDKDYHVKGSSIISGTESQSQNGTAVAATEAVVTSMAGNNDDETRMR